MKTLIINDLQNDFHPAGMAPLASSDELIPIINEQIEKFDLVIASKFWYPADHDAFAANHLWRKPGQVLSKNKYSIILKEMHCIAESFGAELMMGLNTSKIQKIILKGCKKEVPPSTAFFDADGVSIGLLEFLNSNKVKEIHLLGLNFENALYETALEAIRLGFGTKIIQNGTANLQIEQINFLKKEGVYFK